MAPVSKRSIRRSGLGCLVIATLAAAGAVVLVGPVLAADESVSTSTLAPGGDRVPSLGMTTNSGVGVAPLVPEQVTTDPVAVGRKAIENSDWKGAIDAFRTAVVVNPKNADAYNLLGYSYRRSGNLAKAFENYSVALKLNPAHRGALEYQGEAFVEAGQTAKARRNLAVLAKVCGKSPCQEYRDLAAAIAKGAAKGPKPGK